MANLACDGLHMLVHPKTLWVRQAVAASSSTILVMSAHQTECHSAQGCVYKGFNWWLVMAYPNGHSTPSSRHTKWLSATIFPKW